MSVFVEECRVENGYIQRRVYRWYKDGIRLLENNFDELRIPHPKCNYFLKGDLNARTKDLCDFIPYNLKWVFIPYLNYIFRDINYDDECFNLPRSNKDILRHNKFDHH